LGHHRYFVLTHTQLAYFDDIGAYERKVAPKGWLPLSEWSSCVRLNERQARTTMKQRYDSPQFVRLANETDSGNWRLFLCLHRNMFLFGKRNPIDSDVIAVKTGQDEIWVKSDTDARDSEFMAKVMVSRPRHEPASFVGSRGDPVVPLAFPRR
jgi:hypothetical protein